jgi:hypothetical protein
VNAEQNDSAVEVDMLFVLHFWAFVFGVLIGST